MNNIQKIETKKGKIRYRVSIRRKLGSFDKRFDSLEEAQHFVRTMEESLKQERTLPSFNLEVYIDRYELEILPTKSIKCQKSEKTYLAFWRQHLGNKKAESISSLHVEGAANQLFNRTSNKTGLQVSTNTRKKYIQSLGFVYNTARKLWKWIEHSPVDNVNLMNEEILKSQGKNITSPKSNSSIFKEKKAEFVALVHERMKEKNMTQKYLMEQVKISKSMLQNVLNPSHNSTILNILKIANACEIEIRIIKK